MHMQRGAERGSRVQWPGLCGWANTDAGRAAEWLGSTLQTLLRLQGAERAYLLTHALVGRPLG